MNRILFILLISISYQVSAEHDSFSIDIFDMKIQLPNNCIWKLTDTVENNDIAVFKCDEGFDYEVSVVIQYFDGSTIILLKNMLIENPDENAYSTENKLGNITHFRHEVMIETSRGDSQNYIDAFCDPTYCISTFGTNDFYAKSIGSQLKSIPNKPIKQD
jgi:hypothetical protein